MQFERRPPLFKGDSNRISINAAAGQQLQIRFETMGEAVPARNAVVTAGRKTRQQCGNGGLGGNGLRETFRDAAGLPEEPEIGQPVNQQQPYFIVVRVLFNDCRRNPHVCKCVALAPELYQVGTLKGLLSHGKRGERRQNRRATYCAAGPVQSYRGRVSQAFRRAIESTDKTRGGAILAVLRAAKGKDVAALMDHWPVTIALPLGMTVGGMTTWAVRLSAALVKRGRRVRLVVHPAVAGHAACPSMERLLPDGVERISAPDLRGEAELFESIRVYRELLPSILLPGIWAESDAVVAALAATSADRIRVVNWVHSDNPYDYARAGYYEPTIARFVVNSSRCREELLRRVPSRVADTTLIPHGVQLPAPPRRDAIADRPLRLAYVGRMEHLDKRVLHLPALARRLDEAGVRFEMRLVGDGPQADDMDRAITEALPSFKLAENTVRREPAVDADMALAVWQWADVSLLLSAREGLSMAMLEAMAAGCCPLVTAVASGADDVIRDGRNGVLVPVDDVGAMARTLAALAAAPERIACMGRAARETIERSHGFEEYVDRVLEVLDAAVTSPPRPWPASRSTMMGGAPAAGAVPADAGARLSALLRRIADGDAGPVALYGAGGHTQTLASVLARSPVSIVGVLDDDPARWGQELWGWPIVRPEDADALGARGVVISSWMHEEDIWRRRGPLEGAGLRVYRLYADAAGSRPDAGGRVDRNACHVNAASDVMCAALQ